MDDISNNSSSSWDLEMSMGNGQFLLDHTPALEFFHPHAHHSPGFPASVDQLMAAAAAASGRDHMGSRRHVVVVEEEEEEEEVVEEEEALGSMKEMMYRIAAMQPVDIDPSTIKKPRRRNVRISDDPQSVAARHRRERISERIRILQRLVPGGTKMDTASMLDEAIRYVKFLKRQVQELQANPPHPQPPPPLASSSQLGVVIDGNPIVGAGTVEWHRPEARAASSPSSSPSPSSSSSSAILNFPGLGFRFPMR